MFYYYFDRYYWILIVPAMLFAMWAQTKVNSTYNRYNRVYSARGMSAAQVCRLSDSVYASSSVAAIGVAAHEAGHAVQYAVGYVPIKVRNAVIPLSQFGSSLSMPVLLIGLLFNQGILVQLGIVLFSTVALFQLVTLPVEFDASSRALKTLEGYQLLDSQETQMAGKVLKAAALTYVAALLSSLAQLFRLIMLYGRRNDD